MADDESSSTSDESLDATSVKFNPMKALYSKKIQLSASKAPIYDNVSKFEAVISGLAGQKKVRITLRVPVARCRLRSFVFVFFNHFRRKMKRPT